MNRIYIVSVFTGLLSFFTTNYSFAQQSQDKSDTEVDGISSATVISQKQEKNPRACNLEDMAKRRTRVIFIAINGNATPMLRSIRMRTAMADLIFPT